MMTGVAVVIDVILVIDVTVVNKCNSGNDVTLVYRCGCGNSGK